MDFTDRFDHAALSFHERTAVPGGYRYEPVDLRLPDGRLHTTVVPRIGDRITLGSRLFRIVDLEWDPPSMGSYNWPHPTGLKPEATGIAVNILVERVVSGMYTAEVVDDEDEAG
jgi:hypothetical protein